ncbi:hypothetical protein FZEAL_8380 [Fusarium zealandicum]|uniref:Uncharacterized protein n=1 Tax=Fusarium zealandicum TaxID=1053134 RepID=A0A8H4UE37_9HYPO|nr:hypothetical protein FZEAL_8380 [Fusarium zealandicum]
MLSLVNLPITDDVQSPHEQHDDRNLNSDHVVSENLLSESPNPPDLSGEHDKSDDIKAEELSSEFLESEQPELEHHETEDITTPDHENEREPSPTESVALALDLPPRKPTVLLVSTCDFTYWLFFENQVQFLLSLSQKATIRSARDTASIIQGLAACPPPVAVLMIDPSLMFAEGEEA